MTPTLQTKNPDKRIIPKSEALAKWMKKNLFSTPGNSALSIVLLCSLISLLGPFFHWLFVDAIWEGTSQTCRQGEGACLVFIKEKFVFILFGFYPRELLWRPILAIFLFVGMIWWSKEPKRWNKRLVYRWIKLLFLLALLLKGGLFGFDAVPMDKWGGLPLTLLLSFGGFLFSYPIGVLLALGRTGNLPLVRALSVGYIELIRGVPMISLLFMASVMFPLFLPEGLNFPKLFRAQIAIIMFMSAYMAEVVRGGLSAVDSGQYEAADALGLSYWQKMGKIILPQALKIVIPPTVNTAIGMFKDTSLVVIIALSDLLMTTKTSLKDPEWLGFSVEAYLFTGFIYFIFCYSMSRYSSRLEKEFSYGRSHA
ncbi:MAG: amino acid ABC transporter permease [Halobacteriovoraceae bacterium]|nr:amino acid ABC transporter permease [Halobacteriovoraceae bacterium]